MATTQAFRNALHIPVTDPDTGELVIVEAPGGDLYETFWGAGGGGGITPATGEGQVLVSGPGPAYAWLAVAGIDAGTFG
jgi:hypothetical protein